MHRAHDIISLLVQSEGIGQYFERLQSLDCALYMDAFLGNLTCENSLVAGKFEGRPSQLGRHQDLHPSAKHAHVHKEAFVHKVDGAGLTDSDALHALLMQLCVRDGARVRQRHEQNGTARRDTNQKLDNCT